MIKVKFLKAHLGMKVGDRLEVEQTDADAYVSKGIAEVIPGDFQDAVAGMEAKINEIATAAAEKAMAEVVKKASKAGSRRPDIQVGAYRPDLDETRGFKSLGDFAHAVIKMGNGDVDARLKPLMAAEKANGNTEGAAPDAGPTVPVIYANQITDGIPGYANFLGLTRGTPMNAGFTMKFPVASKYFLGQKNVANGVVPEKVAEAGTMTPSKTKWEQLSLSLNKLATVVPLTDELLDDNNVGLDSWLAKEMNIQINDTISHAILRGSGSGEATGILGNAAMAVITRQTNGTITAKDLAKLYSRFYGNPMTARWFVSPDAFGEIMNLTTGSGQAPLIQPNFREQPYGSIFGIPVISTGHASFLGNEGDVMLIDCDKIYSIYRSIQTAVSIHLYFLTGETAFRATVRYDAKPCYTQTFELQNSLQVAPYVCLSGTIT